MIPNALLSVSQKHHWPQEIRSYSRWEGVRMPLLMVPRQKGEEAPKVKNGTTNVALAQPCCK